MRQVTLSPEENRSLKFTPMPKDVSEIVVWILSGALTILGVVCAILFGFIKYILKEKDEAFKEVVKALTNIDKRVSILESRNESHKT